MFGIIKSIFEDDTSFLELGCVEEFLADDDLFQPKKEAELVTTPPHEILLVDNDDDEDEIVYYDALEYLTPPERTKEEICAAIKRMIIIEKRKNAYPYAKLFDLKSDPSSSSGSTAAAAGSHLVIWTDASWHKAFAGVGIISRRLGVGSPRSQSQEEKGSMWIEQGYTILPPLPDSQELFCYEVLGIGLSLKLAAEQVQGTTSHLNRGAAPGTIKKVTIFCDCITAIHKSEKLIRKFFGVPKRGDEPTYGAQSLLTGAKSLQVLWDAGVAVEIRWSPGHCGIKGNERADQVAKLAGRYGCLSVDGGLNEQENAQPHVNGDGKGEGQDGGEEDTPTPENSLPPTPPDSVCGEVVVAATVAVNSDGNGKRNAKRKRSSRGGVKNKKVKGAFGKDTTTAEMLVHASVEILGPNTDKQPQQQESPSLTEENSEQQQQEEEQHLERQPQPQETTTGKVKIMRIPVPVLRAVNKTMRMANCMSNPQSHAAKLITQHFAGEVMGLLKQAGREEGWMMDEFEI